MERATKPEAPYRLQSLGQSLWLDSISREMLASGRLAHYRDAFAVTGLTSNPTIFDKAVKESGDYDEAIHAHSLSGKSAEAVFFDLALEDLCAAAQAFEPAYTASSGRDGWVSLEVSPLLADDAAGSVAAAVRLHARAGRPNMFIKIPGTPAGIRAIEEAIYRGVPVNVTLLFSAAQYRAALEAYWHGIERRVAAGRDPRVASVASLFVSRWDVAVARQVPAEWRNRLGVAVAKRTYRDYCASHASERWRNLAAAGALKQRLLWASTGTKDKTASDTLYIEALAAPDTINTMPEQTLKVFADHGRIRELLPADGGDANDTLARFAELGIDLKALAERLQREGAAAFDKSWHELMAGIAAKHPGLRLSPAGAATRHVAHRS